MILFLLLHAWLLNSAFIAPPIILRHDRADSLSFQLGSRFPSLVHLYLPTPKGAADGEGTLIAPRWVLTAAHVGAEIRSGHPVSVGTKSIKVDSVIIHPDWKDGGPHDLALLRLEKPVDSVRPADLYRGSDERDRILMIVGYGDYGTGLTGPRGNDRRVRGATNRVDEATDLWLKFRFDAPDDPRTTGLEGVSGPGDSGGPAYFGEGDSAMLVGVSSGQSSRATGGKPGHYGVVEYYVRVSRYVKWIESIIGPISNK